MKVSNAVDITGNSSHYVENYIDIFYYEHQYMEYAAVLEDKSILEQYENYHEILQKIEEEFYQTDMIFTWSEAVECNIYEVELDHIRKTANNMYYLNYKVKCDIFIGGEIGDTSLWAHAVVEPTGNQLEYKEIVFGEKREQSESGLPVYYGI